MLAKNVETIQKLLKYAYGFMPIVVGLDKFTHFLVDWSIYLSPVVAKALPVSETIFLRSTGVIEILAGVLVLSKWTKLGAIIVSAWLSLISLNLILLGYYDVAARDIVLAIGAYSLASLASIKDKLAVKREYRTGNIKKV